MPKSTSQQHCSSTSYVVPCAVVGSTAYPGCMATLRSHPFEIGPHPRSTTPLPAHPPSPSPSPATWKNAQMERGVERELGAGAGEGLHVAEGGHALQVALRLLPYLAEAVRRGAMRNHLCLLRRSLRHSLHSVGVRRRPAVQRVAELHRQRAEHPQQPRSPVPVRHQQPQRRVG